MTYVPTLTQPLPPTNATRPGVDAPSKEEEMAMQDAAKRFEASFISQMLKHGGLAKALTSGGGQGADAFTGFYIEQLATKVADQGGFGLAENIYEQLQKYKLSE